MSAIIIKQHDTKITFTDTPTIDGVPVLSSDLSGCTLSFILKGKANDGSDVAIKQTAMLDLSGANAAFKYDPVAGDVAKDGKFKQEWEAIYPSGKILTFPNNGYNTVKIVADLG